MTVDLGVFYIYSWKLWLRLKTTIRFAHLIGTLMKRMKQIVADFNLKPKTWNLKPQY